MSIKVFSQYGDPRRQAAAAVTASEHGLDLAEIEAMRSRFETMMPKMAGGDGGVDDVLSGLLPDGATLGPGAGDGYRKAVRRRANMPTGGQLSSGGGGGTYMSPDMPYQPEFADPSRQSYPVHRILANRYWRLFYKLDPTIGSAIDYFSELPWGNFELTGDGVDGEIKDTLETMCDETQIRSVLPFLVREFLVIGEACPHLFFDDDKGMWSYITLHNPDQLEVIDAPFVKMDPVVEFIPDQRLREILMSDNPMLRKVRESMPDELLTKLISNENIPLSPINFTFLPRKLHPYDARGTSVISRMWRVLMYEDAIFNASLQTARRMAGPLKVAKLGNPQNGWIPGPAQEKKLLQLLTNAQLDPQAWLVYHYALNFELVGVQERVMTIDKHYDLIERIKLVAMGLSKAFLSGDVPYASAAAGLTIFMKRLIALRRFFEDKWLYPKFFKTVSRINKWVKPTEAELSGRIRIRRSQKEVDEDNRWIVPKIEWEHSLDPTVDAEMLNAVQALESMGVQFSKSTKASLAGRDYEEEAKQRVKDYELERKVFKDYPELMAPEGGEGGPGGMGGPPPTLPPMSGDSFGETLAPGEDNPGGAPGGEPMEPMDMGEQGASMNVHGTDDPNEARGQPKAKDDAGLYDDHGRYGIWHKTEVRDLLDMFDGFEPEEEPWVDAYQDKAVAAAAGTDDAEELWSALEEWLIDRDFPAYAVADLERLLGHVGVIAASEDVHNQAQQAQQRQAKRKIRPTAERRRHEQLFKNVREPTGSKWFSGSGW